MASIKNPKDTRGHAIAASQVNGTNVYNTSGEKLGSVHDVILDKMSGKAEYAIMSFGGFLGIGDKYHPLPWSQLRYDTSRKAMSSTSTVIACKARQPTRLAR